MTSLVEKSRRPEQHLVTNFSPTAPTVECYRILRTNLRFLDAGKPLKSVLITSALPKEGKTLTACNLAIVTAVAGGRVVIVDADLRKSRVHTIFHLDNQTGLTTVLAGETTVEQALRTTPFPTLKVLPAGPRPLNPAELLGSARMAAVLTDLASRTDTVIIDTSPVMAVTDGIVLAGMVDGVILVVRAGAVSYQTAQKAKAALERVKARLLGVVLNEVSPKGLDSYTYSYHYEYRETGEPSTRSKRSR